MKFDLHTTRRWTTAAIACFASSCGGGSDSSDDAVGPEPLVMPTAGLYVLSEQGSTGTAIGNLLVSPAGYSTYVSGIAVGSGQWIAQTNAASIALERYPLRGLGFQSSSNSTGGAGPPNTIVIGLTPSADGHLWSNATIRMDRFTRQTFTPDHQSMAASGWRYSDIIAFNHAGDNESYSVHIVFRSDGSFSGTDSKGCRYAGQLQPPAHGFYTMQVTASQCMPSRFVADGTYSGAMFMEPGATSGTVMHIFGVDMDRSNVISLPYLRQ